MSDSLLNEISSKAKRNLSPNNCSSINQKLEQAEYSHKHIVKNAISPSTMKLKSIQRAVKNASFGSSNGFHQIKQGFSSNHFNHNKYKTMV